MTTIENNHNNYMNKLDFTKKVLVDFGSGALGFITLGGYHYVTVCRENDKQLEVIRNERLNIEKERMLIEKENELQLKRVEEKLQKYSWFKL
jgi:hypothetical protein